MKKNVLDLFCGSGGLSFGFEMSKYNVVFGIDNTIDALKTFEYNHKNAKTLCADLSTINPIDIEKNHLKNTPIDVIVGGPPCQGFSISGKRDINDPRNKLYQNFVDFVEYFKPKAFVMENVPNLVSMNNGLIKDEIISNFSDLGYKVSYKILTASDYNVPQNRKRVFFIGLLDNKEFEFPKAITEDDQVTSFDAISDLPEYGLEDGSEYSMEIRSDYQQLMRSNSKAIYNHQITNHTEATKNTIALVPDGGNYKSLPKELQETRKVNIAWTRLNSKKPSFTIDTGHRHHFHYKYNRVPTVREAARIQSFPDDFIFSGSKTAQEKQVGNAVPPLLSFAIAEQLLKFMDD